MKWVVCILALLAPSALLRADSGDDTLDHSIEKSDLIISGKILSEVIGEQEEMGVSVYHHKIEVIGVLHGKSPNQKRFDFHINRFESSEADALPYMKRGSKCIFFLKKKPYWREADVWSGAQPYNSHVAKRIKELSERKKR